MKALITGITGQDGYYLSQFLLEKGYDVHGFARRGSLVVDPRIRVTHGDVTDPASLYNCLMESEPDEIYHLAAQSHVGASFFAPSYTMQATAQSLQTILEVVRAKNWIDKTKIYQASSSEMFGNSRSPQNEDTPFAPRSPYAVAKVAAHHTAKLYRESYGMYVACGILFNHESERRPETFVTRKITRAVARYAAGKSTKVTLGNLKACRDWGYAPEYVEAMWMMMQQTFPEDYVVATGEAHSVEDFLEVAAKTAGVQWQEFVEYDDRFKRPADVDVLRGDASKALTLLGWKPKVRFAELVERMVKHDMAELGL